MSGICGIVRFDGKPVESEEIGKMLAAMPNRGHDGEGVWSDGSTGFGHRLLWTTPESLHENQPLVSEDGNLILTADARIDNRDELFAKLGIKERDFVVITDADLILLAYRKWGAGCAGQLIGDFAFAIWDKAKRVLFATRDRVGVRQFVYTKDDRRIIFASDISALFALRDLKKELNVNSVENFLINTYLKAIAPQDTYFKGVLRLPSASLLQVKDKKFVLKKYWSPADLEINSNSLSENCEIFMVLLQQSIKARLRSAFPVGTELSGGFDSSTVLSVAAKLSQRPIKAFALQFGDMECDESEYIDAVIKQTNSPLFGIRADQLDYQEQYSLPKYYKMMPDYPADGFFLPMVATLERAAEEGVRVLLTGQGGDYLVLGNQLFLYDWLRRGGIFKVLSVLANSGYRWQTIKQSIVRPFFSKTGWDLVRKITFRPSPAPILASNRLEADFEDVIDSKKYLFESNKFEALFIFGSNQALAFDMWHYNLAGRMNIEVRHPFYDSRLVEFALKVPKEQKYDHQTLKPFLKEATKGVLPEKVRLRDDKKGFSEAVMLQAKAHIDLSDLEKRGLFCDGFLRKNIVKKINTWYANPEKKWHRLIWQTMVMEEWSKYHWEDEE